MVVSLRLLRFGICSFESVISKIKVLLQVHTHTRYLAEYRVTGFIYFKTSEALWPKHT